MLESMNLFTEVIKNPAFKSTPIFIFLNKKDLFEEMIVHHPLTKCFPDYTGPLGEAQPALAFIEKVSQWSEQGVSCAPVRKFANLRPINVNLLPPNYFHYI